MSRARLRQALDSLLGDPEFGNAHWGVLIVDPTSGDTLYARNADKLFLPASNMKLVTAAVALATLGHDFTFTTPFVAGGTVHGDTLHGTLYVAGSGDPTLSPHFHEADAMNAMRAVADSLRAHGVTHITGGIAPAGDPLPWPPWGYGWSWEDLREGYGAGVDELFFNEGAFKLAVTGSPVPGAAPTVSRTPDIGYPEVIVRAITVEPPRDTLHTPELVVVPDFARGALTITGTIAARSTEVLDAPFPDQTAAFLAALRTALAERGVTVEGTQAPAPLTDTLFVLRSPTLAELLPAMQKPSQNQIAELLLRTVARVRTGIGTADSAQRIVDSTLVAWGVDSTGFVIRDGSGVSRYDYLSPRTLVTVLARMWGDSAYYDALPIAGVDGTLAARMHGTPAWGNAHAKTGFVSNARSLSGYVTSRDGHHLVFSLLANNWTAPRRDVERVQDAIVALLASLELGATRDAGAAP
ncbi:MAG TPA: D-alanyl-D-alanine carboxypeptidase/D-alanyl-D-alanine-endopeptidase [Gemmatimonadaceae bacterium]|nr:D-alanyl-D-alanine carboxypeptidase/D-alanyl-D-alanine-endopeptidase [Gemmatimonadaceae bacterium]